MPNHAAPNHAVRPRCLPRLPRPLGMFALAVVLVGAACNANGSQPAGAANSVSIVDYAFNPATTMVKAGTTVTWTNTAGQDHTVTADDASFDSGHVAAGTTFSHTFAAAGTFSYHCTIHAQMTGTITVTP
jgi:plastocyanin